MKELYETEHEIERLLLVGVAIGDEDEVARSLDELEDCVAENIDDTEQLGKYISEFLFSQPKDVRQVFVRRYFYSDSIADISKLFGMSESRIKSMLHRTRQRLQSFLAERDINI